MPQQAKTWGELRALLAELTEEQLNEPLTFWGESSVGKAVVFKLAEDQYTDGEFIEPKSVYSEEELSDRTLYAKAGSLIIDVDKQPVAIDKQTESHLEHIACPVCQHTQTAEVLHTTPFSTYIHDCWVCGYTIMESEWQVVPASGYGETSDTERLP